MLAYERMRRLAVPVAMILLASCASRPAYPPPTTHLDRLEQKRPGLVALVRSILTTLPADSITACIGVVLPPTMERADPGRDFLAVLTTYGRLVVGPDQCPRTYEAMVSLVDSLGRPLGSGAPPGHRDPYIIELLTDAPDSSGAIRTSVRVWRGTNGIRYVCRRLRATAPNDWSVDCIQHGRMISERRGAGIVVAAD
jgi:hypothetical protein